MEISDSIEPVGSMEAVAQPDQQDSSPLLEDEGTDTAIQLPEDAQARRVSMGGESTERVLGRVSTDRALDIRESDVVDNPNAVSLPSDDVSSQLQAGSETHESTRSHSPMSSPTKSAMETGAVMDVPDWDPNTMCVVDNPLAAPTLPEQTRKPTEHENRKMFRFLSISSDKGGHGNRDRSRAALSTLPTRFASMLLVQSSAC